MEADERSTEEEADERICDICMSAPRAVRFHPCGHSVACELCTLQLIAKCPGSNKAESLFCPHCKAPITKIEKDRAGASKPLSRQKTFVPSAFDPLSLVDHAITADQEVATSGVLDFIESYKESADGETRAAAEAALKTWTMGTPPAATVSPYWAYLARIQQQALVPPHPLVRAIAGVFAVSFLCVFAWGLHAIVAIRSDFDSYLASQSFSVQVTRVDAMQGPLNALVPPTYNATATYDGALAALPFPSAHQQWWALMTHTPASSEDTQDIEMARRCVFWLVVTQLGLSLIKPIHAVLRNKSDMVKTLSIGLDLMIGMAILGALFPMHWDVEHHLVMIMYVPGWAVLWSLVWMAMTSAACLTFVYRLMRTAGANGDGVAARLWTRENLFLGCLATGSCCYWMWFLYVPLLFYAVYFAEDYAEVVTAQALDTEYVAALPFAGASAAALYLPIRIAPRLGMCAYLSGIFLLPQLNQRLMPQPQPAAAVDGAAALV